LYEKYEKENHKTNGAIISESLVSWPKPTNERGWDAKCPL